VTLIGLNWPAIAVGFLACFVIGFVWFSPRGFFPIWWAAIGKAGQTPGDNGNPTLAFGGTFVGIFLQVLTLAVILNTLQQTQVLSVLDGAWIGFCVGGGIAAMASLSHRLFAGQGLLVWALESGNDVLNLTVAGAIYAAMS
jgi:hypothetical protein